MTVVPSSVRVVRLWPGGAGPNMGLLGPAAILTWPSLYPYYPPSATVPWSWLIATAWCQDPPADVITQVGVGVSPADGTITGWERAISSDGMSAGVQPIIAAAGLTPGITYIVSIHLTCIASGKDITVQVRMPTSSLDALPAYDPTKATLNGDVALIGGFPYPIGASA